MREERAAPVKQASFDGLCGLFCLVNAIRNWGESSFGADDRDGLRYLIEAADRLGLFSTHRYIGGFETHEMIDIFNEFARAHRFPGRACHLSSMADALDNWSFSVQAKRVFEQGGQIVVPIASGSHWVLAYAHDFGDSGLIVDDPEPDLAKALTSVRYQSVYLKGRHGVLLLPKDCTLSFPD